MLMLTSEYSNSGRYLLSVETCVFIVCLHSKKIVHRCGTGGTMRACHAAGPGSIPGRDKFPGLGFFGVFPHL